MVHAMTVHRARVTAVDARGVFVRAAALGPDIVGPLEWLGSKPKADDGVLVLNAGSEAAPDLVVMVAGEFARLCSGNRRREHPPQGGDRRPACLVLGRVLPEAPDAESRRRGLAAHQGLR